MALRWRIPFTSRKGKFCRIDIYDPSYTGSTVTELSTTNADAPGVPAADPFYYEEDDDEDLLKVVRIKTGYINLIETQFDGLTDIYATSLKSRYVEVFYDSTIVFRGYIQQQTFENDWCPAPREVSLPVISVMGLTESLSFDTELPLTDKSLGYYMKQLLRKIEPIDGAASVTKYNRVLFPANAAGDITATIHPTVVTVDNPDFSKARSSSSSPYKGITLYDLLEGICNAYGWIVHDMPTCILFTQFDKGGTYYYYPVDYSSTNDIETLSGRATTQQPETDATLQLGNLMEPSADDSTITQIMPYRTVNAKFDGELVSNVDMTLDHMRAKRLFEITETEQGVERKYALATLVNADSNTPDISSSNLANDPSITTNWIFSADGVIPVDMESQHRIMVQNPAGWVGSGALFTMNFYKRPMKDPNSSITERLKLDYQVAFGNKIYAIDYAPLARNIELIFWLQCGYVSIRKIVSITTSGDNLQGSVYFEDQELPNTNAVTLSVYMTNPSDMTYAIMAVDKLSLGYEEVVGRDYLVDTTDHENIGIGDGSDDVDVDMLINCRRISSNMLGSSTHEFVTYYRYLRQPQTRLQLRMIQNSGNIINAPFAYINKIIYWMANWRWRLIAMSFHPRDDEYTLTMHRSPAIE